MEAQMNLIIKYFIEHKMTLATMESCTGGGLSNLITNVEGASQVFHFGASTYSNEAKIKMGVDPKAIENYSVYSIEVAREMAKSIARYAAANYGIGITGRFGVEDPANLGGDSSIVYISIYDAHRDVYMDQTVSLGNYDRPMCKDMVLKLVTQKLFDLLFQGEVNV